MPDVRALVRLSPFQPSARRELVFPEETTVAEIIESAGVKPEFRPYLRVAVGDEILPADEFATRLLGLGTSVVIDVVPGTEILGSSTIRLLLSTAISLGSGLLGQHIGGVGGRIAGAVIGLGGTLAVSALLPPSGTPVTGRGYALTGSQNQLTPFGVVPRVFGRHRFYPPLAAVPFTEASGGDQYLRMLFVLGYGPLEISDMRIGSTALTADKFQGLTVEVVNGYPGDNPITLYSKDVWEEQLNSKLTLDTNYPGAEDGWVTRTTARDHDEFQVEITFPNGLARILDSAAHWHAVDIEIQYRPLGSTIWTNWIPMDPLDIANEAQNITTSALYQEIDRLIDELDDTIYFIQVVLANDADWLPSLNILNFVVRQLNQAIQRLPNLENPPDPQRIADLQANLDALAARMQTVVRGWEGTRGLIINSLLNVISAIGVLLDINWMLPSTGNGQQRFNWSLLGDELAALNDIITLMEHLQRGYAPQPLENFPAFIRWIAFTQGSAVLFGAPAAGRFRVRDRNLSAVRRTFTIDPPGVGQWEVRVRRATKERQDQGTIADEVFWTALRSVRHDRNPVSLTGVALVAMRIKATDQLNGVVDQFNVIAQARIPVWDGTLVNGAVPAYTNRTHWPQLATRNPAWAFVNVLCGEGNKRPLPISRLDMTAIKAWADDLETEALHPIAETDGTSSGYWGRCFDAVISDEATVWEVLEDIAAAGRASVTVRDGLYSIVRDVPQTTPIQFFTPRNSWGFRGARTMQQFPTAMKVRYLDEAEDYKQTEVVVPCPGYMLVGDTLCTPDEVPVTSPTYETIDAFGCTSKEQARLDGVYHIAQAYLRSEIFELNTDVEHIVCQAGDLVAITHDVPMFGLGFGRVAGIEKAAGNITAITLDDAMPMDGGVDYTVRVRLRDGNSASFLVRETLDGYYKELPLVTATADSTPNVAIGDLAVYGTVEAETILCIVKEVEPQGELSARLTLVDAAHGIHSLQGTGGLAEMFNSHVTIPPDIDPRAPLPPLITSIVTDEGALISINGTLVPHIRIAFSIPASAERRAAAYVDAQFRPSYDDAEGTDATDASVRTPLVGMPTWRPAGQFHAGTESISIGNVLENTRYDVRIRSVSREGYASEWTSQLGILVTGKLNPPPDVLSIWFDGQRIQWTSVEPIDFAGYIVRIAHGDRPTWDGARSAFSGRLVARSLGAEYLPRGTFMVMVKMIDTGGRESVSPQSLALSISAESANEWLTTDLLTQRIVDWVTHPRISITGGVLGTGELPPRILALDPVPAALTAKHISGAGVAGLLLFRFVERRFWGGNDAPFWADHTGSNIFWSPRTAPFAISISGEINAEFFYPGGKYPVNWNQANIDTYVAAVWLNGNAALAWDSQLEFSANFPDRVVAKMYNRPHDTTNYWQNLREMRFSPYSSDEHWPIDSGWAAWPGELPVEPGVRYGFLFAEQPRKAQYSNPMRVSLVELKASEPFAEKFFGFSLKLRYREEVRAGVAIGGGGSLNLVADSLYISITRATVDIVEAVGQTAVHAMIAGEGQDATTGRRYITIKTYDSAGNAAAATVDVTLRGV